MKKFIKKLLWGIKHVPKYIYSTFICIKYPFLKSWNRRDKLFQKWDYLSCMEKGWKKAFGLQMCKEIKASLLKTGGKQALKNYHVDQIKEKWGILHWYDIYGTLETHKIIHKYEEISMHTCVSCGKPATVRTTGWICPYCDNCVGDQKYVHFGHKIGPSWYGWRGNIDDVPEKIWNEEEEFLNNIYGTNDTPSRTETPD